MAHHLRERWQPTFGSGIPRRARQGCEYDAYVPDALGDRPVLLNGSVAADVADAEAAITRLNAEAVSLVDSEALARLLLRAEAVASSRIEGLEVGGRRLLRAQAARALGDDPRDVTAEEILANIGAMAWAIETVAAAPEITVGHLLEMHRRLLAGTRTADQAGQVRTSQNWIGGSSYNPCGAAFIPPPPGYIQALLEDLCRFCSDDALSPLVQAALAHAQFETIHPFHDGNGRTGRALIHVIMRRRGLAPRTLPPVSLVLATWPDDYVGGLTATRYLGDATGNSAQDGLNRWVELFASACSRAVADAHTYEERVHELHGRWRATVGRVRNGSAADLLLATIPGTPILTVASAATLIGRTFQATNDAIARLVAAEVLRPVRVGRRNRAFEAPDLVDAFADLERRLASPLGDTRSAPPVRPAPRRG
ncbi:MAG: Fic family protein [Dehalococcoidia bacterium]